VAFVITAFCLLTSVYRQERYTLQTGVVSPTRFKATREVENVIATERNRTEAQNNAAEMLPIRNKDTAINERVIRNVSELFISIDGIRAAHQSEVTAQAMAEQEAERQAAELEAAEREAAEQAQEQEQAEAEDEGHEAMAYLDNEPFASTDSTLWTGVLDSLHSINSVSNINRPYSSVNASLNAMQQLDNLPLALPEGQRRLLLDLDNEDYEKLKLAIHQSLENVLEQGVQEIDGRIDIRSLHSLEVEFFNIDITSEMRNIGNQIASTYLEPNFVINEAATEAARMEIASQYTVVEVREGQTIVDEGQVITLEIFTLLETLGLISDGLQDSMMPIVAAIAIIAVLYVLCFVYMRIFCPKLVANKKEAALLFSLYTVVIIAVRLLIHVPYQFLPILIFTMLVAMLIDLRLSVVLNIFVTICAMMIHNGDTEFFIFFSVTGLAVSLLAKKTTERNHLFIVGIAASALSFILMFLTGLYIQRSFSPNILIEAGYAAGNGIFTVIVCLGTLPFWEAFFGVITNIKLLDLTDPNNALLRKLIIEAPGTYHHSLIVANLAETAAYEIGADANLARVGGYYHDVGKVKNPHYFAENQTVLTESPHVSMKPRASADVILDHVKYGLDLASEHKLPQAVKDMIVQHHGTTLVQYFYCKAKEACDAGETVNESDFRYPFVMPQNKEAAVLMLADTVEAAIRSMKNGFTNYDELELCIKRLIKTKLDDGQLLDSGLSIKDLELITKAFLRVFKGMYHERIEYPKIEAEDVLPAEGEVSTA